MARGCSLSCRHERALPKKFGESCASFFDVQPVDDSLSWWDKYAERTPEHQKGVRIPYCVRSEKAPAGEMGSV
jgi:exonuclease III